ncbi:hypothetical protein [Microbacterium sp. UCD-TDU]|uniref:hypothetical protein n=1 Tax=Microbacterium sp. UCD-TDU TaxID=1247714 RepID=UPI000345E41F|nr:hypothetical protein [Microbacterium sp. UCD-TDU]EYT61641.1 hypothetical protein D514_0102235 [Microbacterium sp. UCD-TDU]
MKLSEYVTQVINDPKYGHDLEWVKGNLHRAHLEHIEAAHDAEVRAGVVTEEPEGLQVILDACRAALEEGRSAIEFIESERGHMRSWERMVADSDRDAVTVQRAIDLLAAAGVPVKQEGTDDV